MSLHKPSIKKKKGERVTVPDFHIEPLNLLIPGGAPVLVPKHKAWPGQKKKQITKVEVSLPADDFYDAEEEDELDERPAAEVKSRKISLAAKGKPKRKKGTDSYIEGDNKLSRADVQQRIKELRDCIARFEAMDFEAEDEYKKAAAKARDETETEPEPEPEPEATTTADEATQTSDDGRTSSAAATDGSEKVRNMLEALKIRAAGADDNGDRFTPSEDSQILARKEAGESFKTIAGYMKRTKKQVSQRHAQLVKAGKTAETAGTDGNGEGAAANAATAGDTTTEAEKTDAEADAPVAKGDFGGLFDLGDLTTALEAVAAEQANKESEAEKKKKDDSPGKSDKASKEGKAKDKPTPGGIPKDPKEAGPEAAAVTAPEAAGGEGGGHEGGSEAPPDDAGTLLYINQYARQLLRNKDRIPDADDRFDEDDCILLALVESQQKHDRWEQIQAAFANLTGRMVPVEVLKYKLGKGKRPEGY